MTCEQVQFELKAYLDGELGWFSKRRLERHLTGCETCRAERDALAAVSAEFRDRESFELPEALRARLVALAPEPVATIPTRRMPTLAWGAVGGACLATLAAIYLKPGVAPTTRRNEEPSLVSAPAAPTMSYSQPKSDAKVAAEAMENRAAPPLAKPAQTFGAAAPRGADFQDAAKSSFDKEPAKKARGRNGLASGVEVEFASVAVAARLSDKELFAAAEGEGGKVVTENPLLLEIPSANLAAFRKRVGERPQESDRAKRGERTVKVRIKTSVSVRP